MFRPAILIGIYNHGETIAAVVRSLRSANLPFLIVDDGSDARTVQRLRELVVECPDVRVERRAVNGGRGAALITGFEILAQEGFTHALVLDADGQHDAAQAHEFIDTARRRPDALVLGRPIFGKDAPIARVLGRRLSRFWVHVSTLSFSIHDPLCGYRCYPLATTLEILRRERAGLRMDFDPEIAVRHAWAGTPIVNIPTRVIYPAGGLSNFRLVRDNARITWMHLRLLCEMFARLPTVTFARSRRRQGAGA
jgi:glycosyltransferase involved in cell wall biosynthesis